MKIIVTACLFTMTLLSGTRHAAAIEEAAYKVVKSADSFEVRDYAPQILAEVIVDGDLEGAGSKAFKRLFRYISGDNHARSRVTTRTPPSQQTGGEKIAMTSPVTQQEVQGKWGVSFVMPAEYTLESLPVPDDPGITLRRVPGRRLAAVRYSGSWSKSNYLRYKGELEKWLADNGYTVTGAPVWARYNAPVTPWFLRRNEVLIPVSDGR